MLVQSIGTIRVILTLIVGTLVLIGNANSAALPRIALHPFDYVQYRQHHDNGPQMAQMLTSLLMIELSQSKQLDLLDRSMVAALFSEKSRLLVNEVQQNELQKLPIADFTLTGALISFDKRLSYHLKLVRNSNGQIIGATQFDYNMGNIEATIRSSMAVVEQWLKAPKPRIKSQTKIAFGHFVDISDNDEQLNQGQLLTQKLIAKQVKAQKFTVLSRTQMLPLAFEAFLRLLQYKDASKGSARTSADFLIHGKYTSNTIDLEYPLTLYLYIEQVGFDRELIVLPAKGWEHAFNLVNEAMIEYLPDSSLKIASEKIEQSQKLFFDALRLRSADSSVLLGKSSVNPYAIEATKSTYKPENLAPARRLIKQALAENPHNQLARLTLASFYKADGDINKANTLIRHVIRHNDASSKKTALQMDFRLRSELRKGHALFEPIVGAQKAEQIYNQLAKQGYYDAGNHFKRDYKSDQVFHQTHTLSLPSLDSDTNMMIFERLRSLYYRPNELIRYQSPDEYRKPEWFQNTYTDWRHKEAVIHFVNANNSSRLHIYEADYIPSIEYYPGTTVESNQRRQANLEIAIDGLSSSVYLDDSFIRATIMLAHSLCQAQIKRCALSEWFYSWVVDHTKGANLKGKNGLFYNVTQDIEDKDRLIFLAADPVSRVNDANLSALFLYHLSRNKYFTKKAQSRFKQLDISSIQPSDAVREYVKLIKVQCNRLSPRNWHDETKEYAPSMNALATLAHRNPEVASLRTKLLGDIEASCSAYPYFVIAMQPVAQFVRDEQLAIVNRVAAKKLVPVNISEFMIDAINLFNREVERKDNYTAEQYIDAFKQYYGMSVNTVMDFAFLYRQIGDSATADELLEQYGKKSFTVENFTGITGGRSDVFMVNGDYTHKGFDVRGQQIFTNNNNEKLFFIYNAFGDRRIAIGDKPIKWTLERPGFKRRPWGHKDKKHPELFSFGGNRLDYQGNIRWASSLVANQNPDDLAVAQTIDLNVFTPVTPLTDDELKLPENGFARFFKDSYKYDSVDVKAGLAINGLPLKDSPGPLLDEYFYTYFAGERKLSVVKRQLFDKGFLTVSGMPIYTTLRSLGQRIEQAFPHYDHSDQKALVNALSKAKGVDQSGAAAIFQRHDDSWAQVATLSAEDALSMRHFGALVAINNKHALVCDYKDGLYHFKQIDQQWVQQQKIITACKNVTMNKDWAIVSHGEQATVYKMDGGLWYKNQKLAPQDYLLDQDKGHKFEYYGQSLVITDDLMVVGNPHGGEGRVGQFYLFALTDGMWRQTQVLQPLNPQSRFGGAIAVSNGVIAIGEPSTGKEGDPTWKSGRVFIYVKGESGWQFKTLLVPKNRPVDEQFGLGVQFSDQQSPVLLIKSAKNIYRYELVP